MKVDTKILITIVIALMISAIVGPFVKNAVSGFIPNDDGSDSFQDESLDRQLGM